VMSNKFHGNRPPVLEGIPFIGGLQKFVKVGLKAVYSWQRQCLTVGSACQFSARLPLPCVMQP
jgi:hypothetical protein